MIRGLLSVGERLAGRREPRFYKGLLYAVGEAAAMSASYALLYLFLDEALSGRLTHRALVHLSLGLVLTMVAQIALAQPATEHIFNAAHALMGDARIRMADHLRRLPMGFFTGRRSGELAGVLTTDIALVEDLWSHLFGVFAANLVLPVFVGVGLCVLDWRLGAAVLITLPLAFVTLGATMPIFTRHMTRVAEAMADTNARIVEYVQGIAVLRLFGRHGEGFGRLRRSMEALRDAMIRTEVAPAPLLSIYGFTVEMSFVLVALAGSYLMLGGSLEPRTLLLFLMVSAGVSRRLADFGVALLGLRGANTALTRIEALFDEKTLAEPSGPPPPLEHFDIQLDGVSFAYEKERVLHGVSATLPERRLTALVGPSGSGKSTLVHLIARLWDVPRDKGAIWIGGVDIRDLSFEALHRHIAMVFQDVVLFSGTVLENLRVGKPGATRDEVIAAAKAAQAHAFIERLPRGYDTLLGEGGNALSGGEKQRLSIARAVLKDAPIVLLDEATASVDASIEAELQQAIDELVRSKTVVVIAHRLRSIQRADQILVLDGGRIVERGKHDALLAEGGFYARLWREQERARGWKLGPREGADGAVREVVHA
ncbi:ABC transporter ATP-binding protein [Chondromyces crocatus]|uniref:ABC transporter n=1 Tax=Chondromyces crocatus TaxID=52 RepID=A0A0K1E797_CHOCO|nr:ABC transporter ATP-binding protein [Chondromyces crocatus]AKT36729.1 ABC transporter [Chondromyces crocatus]